MHVAMTTIQLIGLILKTRISIGFQVFPAKKKILWDNLLCFGHHNTLRSLIEATIRSVTVERFQKITLSSRHQVELAVFGFKFANSINLPDHLLHHLQHWKTAKLSRASTFRNASHVCLPRVKKSVLRHSPTYLSLSAFNALSPDFQNASSASSL